MLGLHSHRVNLVINIREQLPNGGRGYPIIVVYWGFGLKFLGRNRANVWANVALVAPEFSARSNWQSRLARRNNETTGYWIYSFRLWDDLNFVRC